MNDIMNGTGSINQGDLHLGATLPRQMSDDWITGLEQNDNSRLFNAIGEI